MNHGRCKAKSNPRAARTQDAITGATPSATQATEPGETERMADAAYLRQDRHTQVAIARQQARQQAMKDAEINPQQQQQQQQAPAQPKQKPKSMTGRKPPRRG
jgi:hypothetical protein